jgi:hypothetical protein
LLDAGLDAGGGVFGELDSFELYFEFGHNGGVGLLS